MISSWPRPWTGQSPSATAAPALRWCMRKRPKRQSSSTVLGACRSPRRCSKRSPSRGAPWCIWWTATWSCGRRERGRGQRRAGRAHALDCPARSVAILLRIGPRKPCHSAPNRPPRGAQGGNSMNVDSVRSALATAGLTALVPHVDALAWPAIRLTTSLADESTLAVGASKLGGAPDLPANTAWPGKQGVPLSFVAQVELADAHPYDVTQSLPATGQLSFFYDSQQATYGTDPADRDGWRVC